MPTAVTAPDLPLMLPLPACTVSGTAAAAAATRAAAASATVAPEDRPTLPVVLTRGLGGTQASLGLADVVLLW